ncbi:isovaleryl-CoA dehydrogenase [Chiayiivirga flava]|uniref:Putative acyl-CoA dehydrogenase n=1 Tax=Chiayiivirga flava TaxID=659595 RepID=A0A7W8D5L0_9GAMM|nr:isovaleryl-CoA dehydrogenase [Chiayiivirga flava]MBB5208354.1 putative acyl-CoA dehydrogenase [Chiayiivirga flava]
MPTIPATHVVENQPPPLPHYNAFATDVALTDAIAREGASDFVPALDAYGRLVGGEMQQLGHDANRNRPLFRPFDRYGHRIDEVEFHSAYHALLQHAIAHGVHALSWQQARPGAHVARAALSYLHHQAEAGTSCPLTMTHAAAPVLRRSAATHWFERCIAASYDRRNVPAMQKSGVTIGMGMTEKQGGSDVRANSTRAHPVGADEYELVGHKWFFSAPMSDAFLVLAQAPGGLTCFLLPRWRPDGTRNALQLQRLKDKLGNWSNASSEVEFAGAWAQRIGEEGRGVATILEMVALTRLDCMLGSAAEMRRALVEAVHHAQHRRAFGKRLVEQPLMRNVLADLALESEAATAFSLRVARAVDAAPRDAREAAFARIATAVGKYWICKRTPAFVNEAQECLGGAGYVEESILPRLYREAPLNSIWEGCGNIQCLDVLRAFAREPDTVDAVGAELDAVRGADARLDAAGDAVRARVADGRIAESDARHVVERLALVLQAAVLVRGAPAVVSDAFCASRLDGGRGQGFGTLAADTAFDALIRRALPPLA